MSLVMCSSPLRAQSESAAEKARESIVYIFFDVTDSVTGAKTTVQGTGFVVSASGYVLTAAHLFRDWEKQTDAEKSKNPVRGTLRDKPGYVSESPLILAIVDIGSSEDIALLKLPHQGARPYQSAPLCLDKPSRPKLGSNLVAYGFPLGSNFQPVSALLGTQNGPGGRWIAASAFTFGMSGGPVYSVDGFVIGVIKGGVTGTDAIRWITPIQHAFNLLKISDLAEACPPSARVRSQDNEVRERQEELGSNDPSDQKGLKSRIDGIYEATYSCYGTIRGVFELRLASKTKIDGSFIWEYASSGRALGSVEIAGVFNPSTREADLRIRRWISRGGGSYSGSKIRFAETYDRFQGDHFDTKKCEAVYWKR